MSGVYSQPNHTLTLFFVCFVYRILSALFLFLFKNVVVGKDPKHVFCCCSVFCDVSRFVRWWKSSAVLFGVVSCNPVVPPTLFCSSSAAKQPGKLESWGAVKEGVHLELNGKLACQLCLNLFFSELTLTALNNDGWWSLIPFPPSSSYSLVLIILGLKSKPRRAAKQTLPNCKLFPSVWLELFVCKKKTPCPQQWPGYREDTHEGRSHNS